MCELMKRSDKYSCRTVAQSAVEVEGGVRVIMSSDVCLYTANPPRQSPHPLPKQTSQTLESQKMQVLEPLFPRRGDCEMSLYSSLFSPPSFFLRFIILSPNNASSQSSHLSLSCARTLSSPSSHYVVSVSLVEAVICMKSEGQRRLTVFDSSWLVWYSGRQQEIAQTDNPSFLSRLRVKYSRAFSLCSILLIKHLSQYVGTNGGSTISAGGFFVPRGFVIIRKEKYYNSVHFCVTPGWSHKYNPLLWPRQDLQTGDERKCYLDNLCDRAAAKHVGEYLSHTHRHTDTQLWKVGGKAPKAHTL